MTTNIAAWREEQRTARAGHHGINAYTCRTCGANTVTIDVDPGVTPMFLDCKRTPGCEGAAVSSGYPDTEPPEHILRGLAWEWFLPTPDEYAALSPDMKAHIDNGGLDLRPRTDRPSAYRIGDGDAIASIAKKYLP